MPIFTLESSGLEDGFVGMRVSFTQYTFMESKSYSHKTKLVYEDIRVPYMCWKSSC